MKTNYDNSILKTKHLLILFGLLLTLSGCNQQGGATVNGNPVKRLHLVFVGRTPDDYWSFVRLGCDYAVHQLGDVDLDFRFPAERTAAAQQDLLQKLAQAGLDGIAVSPLEADNETDFLNTIAAQTLLVCADSDAEKSRRACYSGTDNLAAGKQAAELLKTALPQGGKIILFVGYANAQNTKERLAGIQDALAGSNIQIVDTLADGAEITVAQKNAQEAMAKYPDLAGMVGIYGYHGPAILTAVRAAAKAGQFRIVCFDGSNETLDGIASGDIYGTVAQKPLEIGWQTIYRMVKYLRGDKSELAGGKILIKTQTITKDSVVQYQAMRKSLLARPPNEHP